MCISQNLPDLVQRLSQVSHQSLWNVQYFVLSTVLKILVSSTHTSKVESRLGGKIAQLSTVADKIFGLKNKFDCV